MPLPLTLALVLTLGDNSNILALDKLGVNLYEQVRLEQLAQQAAAERMGSPDDRGSQEQLVLLDLEGTWVRQAHRDSAVNEGRLVVPAARASLDRLAVRGQSAFWDRLALAGLQDSLALVDSLDRKDDRAVQVYRARLGGLEIPDRQDRLDQWEQPDLRVLLGRLVTPASLDLWVHLVRKECPDSVVSICRRFRWCLILYDTVAVCSKADGSQLIRTKNSSFCTGIAVNT